MQLIKSMTKKNYGAHRNGALVKTLDKKVKNLITAFFVNQKELKSLGSDQTGISPDDSFSFFEGFFNEDFYMAAYVDVQLEDPRSHFVLHGQFEDRWPNPLFEADYYMTTHSAICQKCGEDDLSGPLHFLDCDFFTSPSPLLNLESGSDPEGTRRGKYLAIVYGAIDGDDFAVASFDAAYAGKQIERNFLKHDYFSLSNFPSVISAYAFLSASPALFGLNGDANFLLNEKYINHLLQGASFPRSILSWFILSEDLVEQLDDKIQLSDDFNILAIAEVLNENLNVNSMVESAKYVKAQQRTLTAECTTKLSILIICLDNAKMVLSSLAVLLANATSISKVDNFEILILDNASVDADREFLNNNVSFARVVRSEVRVSFGEANNLLAEIATGDYLLFLNSDAFITSSGVERLMSELESDADAVAVAPTLFFPNGIVQEAGGAWLADGSVIQLGKGLASVPDVDISALRPYRSASCLMVRREAFERVGGFSYVFEPAYFEDTFLCAELSLVGRIQTIPSVKVVHLEGFTTNKIEHRSNKEISISLNRQKFVERVKNLDLISSPNALSQTKHNSSTRPKALLVSPYGLMIGGGEQYLLTLAAHLAVTHEVILAYPQVPSKFRFRRVLFDLGIGEFEASLVDFSEALWLRPDVLISMGNSLLPNFPPIGKHSVYHCQFPFPDGDSDSRLRLSWAEQYKALVVNSPFSADHTSAKLRQNPWIDRTHVIYPPVNAKDFSSVKEKPEPQVSAKFRIVSVGRFFEGQHCKNQLEMVRAFAELTREFTDIELTLFGGVAPDSASVNYLRKVTGLVGSKSISVRPDASRRSVLTEINRSHLYWHAAGLGVSEDEPWRMEHFGIAPIEACQLGVFPLVHDSGGVGRNLRTLSDGCVYRDFEELVSMTASLIERDDLPVGRDEIERFGNVFSVENFNENWDILLSSLLED